MINEAITFAVNAHEGQLRKGTNLPYILHPMEVGVIVARMTKDPEVISAAILHDTVEDCPAISEEIIREHFGERVAHLVCTESEDKTKTWIERKGRTIQSLKEEKDRDVKCIALGDKLSNIRSLYRDYSRLGEAVWERFNMKDKGKQGWYYRGVCQSLSDLAAYPEYRELCELVEQVFGDVVADIS